MGFSSITRSGFDPFGPIKTLFNYKVMKERQKYYEEKKKELAKKKKQKAKKSKAKGKK